MFSKQSIEVFASSHSFLSWLLDLTMYLQSLPYLGNKFECPICNGKFKTFLPGGMNNLRQNSKCPRCRSLERHRLIWLFLKNRTNFFTTRLKLLYIAPEYCFRRNLQRFKNIQYISIDLENPIAMMKMDITDLKFNDSSFDCVLCLHVLEHIEDDRKAMKELYRVLKPNGWAILQVPILRDKTFEDPSIKIREQRLKYFGQEDHVREYGLDFKDRLKKAGFQVEVETLKEDISPNSVYRYRLIITDKNLESIYFCAKPGGPTYQL